MQEHLNFRGIWFLPNKAENGIPGFLVYTPSKGIELELMGIFDDSPDDPNEPDLINGITEDGKKITLYKCIRTQRGMRTNSYPTSNYDAIYMFVGKHFSALEELRFENISCVLSDFEKWVGTFGFKKVDFDQDSTKIIIEYERPEDLEFKITDDINLAIRFNVTYPIGKRRSKANITQVTGIDIWFSDGGKEFEKLLKVYQTFHRLMTLAYFTQPLINHLSVTAKEMVSDYKEYMLKLEVYFQTDTTANSYKTILSNNYFLFNFPTVSEHFESILTRWYEMERALEPTIAALTEAFMGREYSGEFKFLGLAQAIETFHRRNTDNDKYHDKHHQDKLSSILGSIKEEYKSWLQEKLQYSHEPSLKQRLNELANEIPITISKLLLVPTVSKFLNQIKDTRNYYTHYNKDLNTRALKGTDLFMLTERMKIFLVCLVLRKIGFSDEEIVETIIGKGVLLFNHVIKYEEVKDIYKELKN